MPGTERRNSYTKALKPQQRLAFNKSDAEHLWAAVLQTRVILQRVRHDIEDKEKTVADLRRALRKKRVNFAEEPGFESLPSAEKNLYPLEMPKPKKKCRELLKRTNRFAVHQIKKDEFLEQKISAMEILLSKHTPWTERISSDAVRQITMEVFKLYQQALYEDPVALQKLDSLLADACQVFRSAGEKRVSKHIYGAFKDFWKRKGMDKKKAQAKRREGIRKQYYHELDLLDDTSSSNQLNLALVAICKENTKSMNLAMMVAERIIRDILTYRKHELF